MIRYSVLAVVISIVAASAAGLRIQQDDSHKQDDKSIQVPAQDPDSISRRDFMRTKLMYSQNILEGLTKGDFKNIEAAVAEIQMITEGEQWVTIDNDLYRKLTAEFKSSVERLAEAAKSKNIDATALRFFDMSTRCIDCHKHITKTGYDF